MPPLAARAYAKVNLALTVGPPLPASAGAHAGFHPICSWFAAIDLWDDLEIERLPSGRESRFEISWAEDAPRQSPIDWPPEKDLAVRAHKLLESATRRALPLRMTLRKRTPVGGGLGGGSSDAAAMLRVVNQAFGLGLTLAQLTETARALGSDVAFFLGGGLTEPPRPAIVSGLGERIEPIAPVPASLVLILPPFGCPTGAVYRAFDAGRPGPLQDQRIRDLVARSVASRSIHSPDLFNDLTPAAHAVAPGLAPITQLASETLRTPVHLTGSGSTLFTLHPSPSMAREAAATITRSSGANVAAIPAALV